MTEYLMDNDNSILLLSLIARLQTRAPRQLPILPIGSTFNVFIVDGMLFLILQNKQNRIFCIITATGKISVFNYSIWKFYYTTYRDSAQGCF